ncbi:hypothetical protein DPX16_7196 [Anabarilius grahami]|uniref:Ig-like domain-containing protein n=1 Tax=Anabarilius grahami TaxID=495550 RepID=A0A3N0XMP6_ANAGA|nr:hypothetical protein DPX16_7196 [Anabarilius grahami]
MMATLLVMFLIKHSSGEPRLHVSSQYVSGYEGGNAVVVCHGASQWCQIGGSCVGSNGGTADKTVVHISGDALNVTLHELKREDSGWYSCSDGESQMPVHITVRKAPYTGQVPVQYTGLTTESSQEKPLLKRVLWLVILGVMLPVIVCAAVILIKVNYKRKQRVETSNPPEGMNNQHLPKVSISDDTSLNVFTVRFDDVQESAQYWCAVHIPSAFDKRAGFFLDVTAGPPSLYVNHQNVSGSENGSVTVTCYHRGQRHVKWCKFAGHCVTGMFGTLDGASVEIRFDQGHMTVTMSGLKKENTGWYWCSTNDQQMPVHITVHHTQALVTAETGRLTITARKRTAIFFLLPVVLEILLIIIIYSALKLLSFCKERCLTSVNEEESQYITMHRSRSSPVSSETLHHHLFLMTLALLLESFWGKFCTTFKETTDQTNSKKTLIK